MFAITLQAVEDGLTWREVLTDLPHDPAALAVYLLLAGSIFLIWRASRTRKPGA